MLRQRLDSRGARKQTRENGPLIALHQVVKKYLGLAGAVVYALILILATIAALDALKFDAISAPASRMLSAVLGAVPSIFIAGVVLLVAYLVGRFVGRLVADLLAGMGFNALPARLGIGREPAEGQRTPSEVVGHLVMTYGLKHHYSTAALLLLVGLGILALTIYLHVKRKREEQTSEEGRHDAG